MSEAFNKASGKSSAPLILVAVVCLAVLVGAVITNRFDSDNAAAAGATVTPASETPVGPGSSSSSRNSGASVEGRMAEMRQTMQAKREFRKQKLEEARLDVAKRFAQEPVDTAWSGAKESNLRALADSPNYKQAGVEPSDLQIDCRSTICKVTASHDSYGSSADWAMIYMTSSAGEIKRTFTNTTTNPDGTGRVEIYAQAR